MIRLLYAQIDHAATRRGPGFAEALKARGTVFPTHVEISRAALQELNQQWPIVTERKLAPGEATATPQNAPRQAAQPRAVALWPKTPMGILARGIKLMRTPDDSGVGDTIARVIGPIGGEAYKAWFKETFGRSCGCPERQADWNLQFPYEKTP